MLPADGRGRDHAVSRGSRGCRCGAGLGSGRGIARAASGPRSISGTDHRSGAISTGARLWQRTRSFVRSRRSTRNRPRIPRRSTFGRCTAGIGGDGYIARIPTARSVSKRITSGPSASSPDPYGGGRPGAQRATMICRRWRPTTRRLRRAHGDTRRSTRPRRRRHERPRAYMLILADAGGEEHPDLRLVKLLRTFRDYGFTLATRARCIRRRIASGRKAR